MKAINIVLLSWVTITGLMAQTNLIPNASFENFEVCPSDSYTNTSILDWEGGTTKTVRFLNTCATDIRYKVPNTGHYMLDSYQTPRTGSGHALFDIFMMADNRGMSAYLQTKLNKPLSSSKVYYAEFYVSLDQSRDTLTKQAYTNSIGLAVFNERTQEDLEYNEVLDVDPAFEYKGGLIRDSSAWTKINGCFAAKGGEQYIKIGNFRLQNEMEVEFEDLNWGPYIIWLFVDDVFLGEFNPLPDEVVICEDEVAVLDATFLEGSYLWNTGDTDPSITVNRSGTYTIAVDMGGGCVLHDTVVVSNLGGGSTVELDTTICLGETLTIFPGITGSYLWSDGTTGITTSTRNPGTISAVITNECGTTEYTTNLRTEICDCEVYVPNAFSPNGDGMNDVFEVYSSCDFTMTNVNFQVFDRWGKLVHESQDMDSLGWDGTVNDQTLANGVFVWVFTYDIVYNGRTNPQRVSGHLSLLK